MSADERIEAVRRNAVAVGEWAASIDEPTEAVEHAMRETLVVLDSLAADLAAANDALRLIVRTGSGKAVGIAQAYFDVAGSAGGEAQECQCGHGRKYHFDHGGGCMVEVGDRSGDLCGCEKFRAAGGEAQECGGDGCTGCEGCRADDAPPERAAGGEDGTA